MIHTYNTTPKHQQAVFDGLVQGLQTYGARMAGHLSSSIHKGLNGLRVTSYSQWDPEASKAFRRSRGAAAVTGLVRAADEGCDRPGRACRWGHPYVHPDERLKPSLRATGGFRGVALRLFPEPAGIATRRSGQATGRKAFVSSLSSNSRLSLPPSSSPVQRSISTSPNTRRGWSVPRRSRRRCGLRATGERRSCRRRWRSSVSSGPRRMARGSTHPVARRIPLHRRGRAGHAAGHFPDEQQLACSGSRSCLARDPCATRQVGSASRDSQRVELGRGGAVRRAARGGPTRPSSGHPPPRSALGTGSGRREVGRIATPRVGGRGACAVEEAVQSSTTDASRRTPTNQAVTFSTCIHPWRAPCFIPSSSASSPACAR